MSDWFKFYDNGMDEPRFRYALRTLSGVCPVWLLILSECCRHKSDSFPWNGDDIDLMGWSDKACTTPEVIGEAFRLLEKIRYIELSNGVVRVRKWNDLQSEYCRKISRRTPDNVRTLSGQTPDFSGLCPSRGEERRGEENSKKTRAPFQKPTADEVKAYAAELGFTSLDANHFIDHYEANGWMVGRNHMKDWKAAVRTWRKQRFHNGSTMVPVSRRGPNI